MVASQIAAAPTAVLSSRRGYEMANAGDIMHQGAECIGQNQTLADAARKMRDLHVGSMPICTQSAGCRCWTTTASSA